MKLSQDSEGLMADPGADDKPPTIHSQATNPKTSDVTERHEARAASGAQADDRAKISTPSQESETIGYAQSLEPTEASEGEHAESRSRFFGDYELLAPIARGGMGVVYKARQRKLNRIVALKMILTGSLASHEEVQRFQTEAEAAAQLDHPGIVPIFEVGEHKGQQYFSMGFVEGGNLSARVRERPLPPQQAAAIVKQIAEAVAYAHERGIIHRDLKPSNVLLDKHGTPKVTDFGLAKQTLGESQLTTSGQVLGTPSYMPPEQAAGSIHAVGPAADIYSLGAVLYCLLTGRPPFQAANSVETLKQVLEQEPVPVRQLNQAVDRDLETICLKCLRKEPGQRYATGLALAEDLRRFLAQEPIQARPLGRAERLARWCRRNPVVAGLIGGIGLSLVLGAAISIYFAVQANREADSARANETAAKKEKGLSDLRAYSAEMNLAFQAWDKGQMDIVQKRLDAQKPELRGFDWHYLDRLCRLELAAWQGHEKAIWSVAFSGDGRWLASAGDEDTIRIWDVAVGKIIRTLPGHAKGVQRVVFSPNGLWLASAGKDKAVRIWELATGQLRFELQPETMVAGLAFSPDSKQLAAAAADTNVHIWDPATGVALRVLRGHTKPLACVAFSPDGRRLATAYQAANRSDGSFDRGEVKVWEVAAGKESVVLQGTVGGASDLAFSPDGERIAAAGIDVRVWDATTGAMALVLPAQVAGFRGVAFSPDGSRLASAGRGDEIIHIWDTTTGRNSRTLRGHQEGVFCITLSPDGRRLASAGGDRLIRIWDATDSLYADLLPGFSSNVQSVAFSSDGRKLAAGSRDGTVRVWDPATVRRLVETHGHIAPINCVAFSPPGELVASAGEDATIRICEAHSGKLVRVLRGHAGAVSGIAFNPKGQRLVSVGADGTMRIWEVATGRVHHSVPVTGKPLLAVSLRHDGRQVATAGDDGIVRIFDAETAGPLLTLEGHAGPVLSIAFDPDGTRLCTAGQDRTLRIWDLDAGAVALTLRGHMNRVLSLAFSPDGRRVASADQGRLVKIWDATTGHEILTLPFQAGGELAFSPDGQQLACVAGNGNDVVIFDSARPTAENSPLREARSLVKFCFTRVVEERSGIHERISRDLTIGEPVRQLALGLAEQYPLPVADAPWLYRSMFRRPGDALDAYREALTELEIKVRLAPRNGDLQRTLAIVQYRLGQYEAALATLTRARALIALDKEGPQPLDLAFVAMCQHRLGHKEQAQATFRQLQEILQQPAWADDDEGRLFLREAEEALYEESRKPTGSR